LAFFAALCAAVAPVGPPQTSGARPGPVQICHVVNPSFEVGAGLDGWTPLHDVTLDASMVARGRRPVGIGAPGGGSWAISALWRHHEAGPVGRPVNPAPSGRPGLIEDAGFGAMLA